MTYMSYKLTIRAFKKVYSFQIEMLNLLVRLERRIVFLYLIDVAFETNNVFGRGILGMMENRKRKRMSFSHIGKGRKQGRKSFLFWTHKFFPYKIGRKHERSKISRLFPLFHHSTFDNQGILVVNVIFCYSSIFFTKHMVEQIKILFLPLFYSPNQIKHKRATLALVLSSSYSSTTLIQTKKKLSCGFRFLQITVMQDFSS